MIVAVLRGVTGYASEGMTRALTRCNFALTSRSLKAYSFLTRFLVLELMVSICLEVKELGETLRPNSLVVLGWPRIGYLTTSP